MRIAPEGPWDITGSLKAVITQSKRKGEGRAGLKMGESE